MTTIHSRYISPIDIYGPSNKNQFIVKDNWSLKTIFIQGHRMSDDEINKKIKKNTYTCP